MLASKRNWNFPNSLYKFIKSYDTPMTSPGGRYHLRLLNPLMRDKRHIITRLMRFIPDLSYETAEEIFEEALVRGTALVRVLNSLSQAEDLFQMLKKADPPIQVDVFDTKISDTIL